jgi:hypothetical protein
MSLSLKNKLLGSGFPTDYHVTMYPTFFNLLFFCKIWENGKQRHVNDGILVPKTKHVVKQNKNKNEKSQLCAEPILF